MPSREQPIASETPAPPEFNPYRPPDAQVADVRSAEPGKLSSRRRRVGAQLLNGIFFMATLVPWMVALVLVIVRGGGDALIEADPESIYTIGFYEAGGTAAVVLVAASVALAVLLVSVQLVLLVRSAQSIGKRLVGIRIEKLNGLQPSIWRLLFLRYLPLAVVGNIPFLGFFVGLLNIGLVLTMEKRCGHDYVAGTRVVVA